MREKKKFKPLLEYSINDGEMGVLWEGKRYRYSIDSALFPQIYREWKKSPGKAFNFLKKAGKLLGKEERRS